MDNIIIKTNRLIIEPRSYLELQELRDIEQCEELKQAYTEMLQTMERLKGKEEWGTDWKISLLNGDTIGGIGFKGNPDQNGIVEIGYGIDEAYQGNGYATEAVAGIVRWALKKKEVRLITAQTDPDNIISQKVLLNNNFVRDGYGNEGYLFKYFNKE